MKPSEFYELTLREFELYVEGWQENQRRQQELLAWLQVNLINVHVPRGKKVTMDKILPRKKKRMEEDAAPKKSDVIEAQAALQRLNARPVTAEERVAFAEAKIRVMEAKRREAELEEIDEAFWDGPEGRKLRELLRED